MIRVAYSEKKPSYFELNIVAQLFNNSGIPVDLQQLKNQLVSQIETVFNSRREDYSLLCNCKIEIVSNILFLQKDKLLFEINNNILNGNPAEADFKGLRIKIGTELCKDIISGKNTRTIPHELGHCLGWDHPHARGQYGVVNPEADPQFEQTMTEEERGKNLMSQSWYIQYKGSTLDEGKEITRNQILLLKENYRKNKINKNRHLRGFLFWKKLIA